MTEPTIRVAVAHAAPVFFDTKATIDKVCGFIEEAAAGGADLIAFPESYVPAFPLWSALQAPIYNHDFFSRLAAQAAHVPGREIARVAACARTHRVFVSLGINEGTNASVGCLWNANLLFGDDGAILNHHRKLVPTFYEKLTWAPGDGAGLRVTDTRLGRIGMLICGENTNPLARYTLMAQGEQLHIASYPPKWPTRDPGADAGNYDLTEAIRIRSACHSFEAKCFTIVAAAVLGDDALTALGNACGPEARRIMEDSPGGASMVIDPSGRVVAGPKIDAEGLLYADLDLAACVEPKQFHDVAGGYNRFDVFDLRVTRRALRPVSFAPEHPRDHGRATPDESAASESMLATDEWDDTAARPAPTDPRWGQG